MFARLLSQDGLPLLMHCSAGKDRTGFGAALLLTALGVAWDDVMADYLATNRLWRREIPNALELPPVVKDTLLTAHATLLTSAFSAVNGAYGAVDAYLERAIGLDARGRADLQARLTL
jgi:protein-tyrosine phosphatase